MMKRLIFLSCLIIVWCSVYAQAPATKKILIVVEGSSDLKNFAIGDGRQLADLLGHFHTETTIEGIAKYSPHQIENFDFTFYIGFHASNTPPLKFLEDVLSTSKPVIWLNTGMKEFSKQFPLKKQFGFFVSQFDSMSVFDQVKFGSTLFTKGEPNINIIEISNRKLASIVATAYSTKKKIEVPYIVRSKNLTYIADSPFASATETDRYLLFSDMLHDILGEQHEESHSALIRIEDVDPLESPEQLRNIADLLSSKEIPFLVSVIPFYVDPGEGIRVSLSDKPEFVDALKYMVKNGATLVMHGVTHQYKGVTASDFEFWDESTNSPIKGETEEAIAKKLELGIQEFMKNGLYPLIWETPHYTASFKLYKTVSKYFSTAMEQRLAIEDFDYSQYFPYVINKDLFGQKIYPENLGYVPLNPDKAISRTYVQNILRNAKANLFVRDGFASVFFHPFLDLDLLGELVDGVQQLGFTYIDLGEQSHWVKTPDRVILAGSQTYSIKLNEQYLSEAYFDQNGEIIRKMVSDKRINGNFIKTVQLEPGQFYKAEPLEYREKPLSPLQSVVSSAQHFYENIFPADENWREAKVAILWNHNARGAAFHDQSSFISAFKSVHIAVDTIFLNQPINLSRYNVLIAPFAFIDSLHEEDYATLTKFVSDGGDIVTDTKNELAKELGISYTSSRVRVNSIRDKYFPEEHISWRYAELVTKFEPDQIDEVFCYDDVTEIPMVIGKKYGNGKVIYINSRFDPYSSAGYSLYPYFLEYVRKYFAVRPIVRRENLEVYFDPGFRHTYSIEQLVKLWVHNGIRIVHAAGWHEYPKYTYDYERLIRLAHANGILVYAWLEPPQVSQKFWNDHPQWREKNYKGEDVRPSWRYPVSLSDDSCVTEMVHHFTSFLQQFDWDGVNIAEVYFESGRGLEDAKFFTPMHPSAKRELKTKYNLDVSNIFDPFSATFWRVHPEIKNILTAYRIDQLQLVYKKLLDAFSPMTQSKPGFEIIVTAMDQLGTPELREYLGVDIASILKLQKEYGFVLQIEDPENKWSTTPMRYIDMGKQYRTLVGDNKKLMLDLNILSFRKKETITPFPTTIQTGTESFHLIRSAAQGSDRFTIYSEASVNPQDLSFFANASTYGVQCRETESGYESFSPYHFILRMPKNVNQVTIDGVAVSAFRENTFLVPAGTHRIAISNQGAGSFSTSQLNTKILSMTGILHSIAYGLREITFQYTSETRTLASFSAAPTSVTVDETPYSFKVMKGNDCYSIFLPPGTHTVDLIAGDQFAFGVNVTSLWSTTAIAIFGSLAIALLLLMYVSLKVIKRTVTKG
ncbi:MAG: DUF2334 domain-containing protein [Bacteroidota bacterium]|nr:DUF2334 domain-containing protein [Bacteroidota bacterium]